MYAASAFIGFELTQKSLESLRYEADSVEKELLKAERSLKLERQHFSAIPLTNKKQIKCQRKISRRFVKEKSSSLIQDACTENTEFQKVIKTVWPPYLDYKPVPPKTVSSSNSEELNEKIFHSAIQNILSQMRYDEPLLSSSSLPVPSSEKTSSLVKRTHREAKKKLHTIAKRHAKEYKRHDLDESFDASPARKRPPNSSEGFAKVFELVKKQKQRYEPIEELFSEESFSEKAPPSRKVSRCARVTHYQGFAPLGKNLPPYLLSEEKAPLVPEAHVSNEGTPEPPPESPSPPEQQACVIETQEKATEMPETRKEIFEKEVQTEEQKEEENGEEEDGSTSILEESSLLQSSPKHLERRPGERASFPSYSRSTGKKEAFKAPTQAIRSVDVASLRAYMRQKKEERLRRQLERRHKREEEEQRRKESLQRLFSYQKKCLSKNLEMAKTKPKEPPKESAVIDAIVMPHSAAEPIQPETPEGNPIVEAPECSPSVHSTPPSSTPPSSESAQEPNDVHALVGPLVTYMNTKQWVDQTPPPPHRRNFFDTHQLIEGLKQDMEGIESIASVLDSTWTKQDSGVRCFQVDTSTH